MTMTQSELSVATLAERLSRTWSKMGAEVGWCDAETQADFDFEIVGVDQTDHVRESALRSIVEGKAIRFHSPAVGEGWACPVFENGRCSGSILCILPEALSGHAEGLFEIFTGSIAEFQKNLRCEEELVALSREVSGNYEELSLIYKLGQGGQISDDPGAFLRRFADDLLELIHARGLILLVNHRVDGTESCYTAGRLNLSPETAKTVGRYLLEMASSGHEPIILPDLVAHPTLLRVFDQSEAAILAWPIQENGSTLGILVAISTDQYDAFDSTDAKSLGSIAEHTASFLQNRFLLADIQELFTGLLSSFVSAIDAKDPYTRGHSQRVAFVGRRIAESLGLSKRECTQMYMAGLLHDIGKIGVSDHVLAKPGKLTREEFAAVQQHPVIGSRIISSVRQLRSILPGVLYHHERYDGKGYSEGLGGEQIPLMGMIVGLADSFDAITSDRTYHRAMNFENAIREVVQCSGTQFSPAVVQGLLDCDLTLLEKDLVRLAGQNPEVQVLPNFNWLK